MSDSVDEPPKEENDRWREADEGSVRAYLDHLAYPTRICAIYTPATDAHHEPAMRIATAISPACAFFDTRRDHPKWGQVARTATHFLMFDSLAFRGTPGSRDHIIDVKFLRNELKPIVLRLGSHEFSEISVYLEKYHIIQLPRSPSNADWLKAAQELAGFISAPTR